MDLIYINAYIIELCTTAAKNLIRQQFYFFLDEIKKIKKEKKKYL